MTIYDDYVAYTLKYQKEYGKKTIVLIQVGSFYEFYDSNEGLIDIKYISELLNIQLSRKNKEIQEVSRSNLSMCGVPLYVLDKYVKMLVEDRYTVVIVSQVTPPPNPRRDVTDIISAGTSIENVGTKDSNNLMTIYIEQNKQYRTNISLTTLGISVIDLSTGMSIVYESSSSKDDSMLALDDCYRLLKIYSPTEIVLLSGRIDMSFDKIVKYLELSDKYVHDKIGTMDTTLLNLNYQTQLLNKVFPNSGLLSVIEFLDLEKLPSALVSYIAVLQFTMAHNDTILTKITKPTIITNDTHNRCTLSYNCIKQLDVATEGNSLLSILNKCPTAIGRRLFKDRLLNPITDESILKSRYETIDFLLENMMFKEIHKNLENVYDIERLYRKMILNKIQPADFTQIDSTFHAVCKILETYSINNEIVDIDFIKEFIEFYTERLNMDIISKYHLDNISTSFFKEGIYKDIDELQKTIDDNISIFYKITSLLNRNNENFFKVETNEKDNYHLTVTKKRFTDNKIIIASLEYNNIQFKDFETKPISASSSILKITHHKFKEINHTITISKNKIRERILDEFTRFVNLCTDKYESVFNTVIKYIGEVDVVSTNAKNAHMYRYSSPIIQSHDKSFFSAKSIRHPIIERISNMEYIPNDVSLGKDKDGMLLYGCNSVGKSSLMKSIGLNCIMAQAGMFVAAERFEYKPYNNIFSRIPSGDNMYKAQSTFALEIGELRNILNRADKNSLVIGDELASGTESVSALSIVATGLILLSERRTSFMFATHLHDLTNISRVKSLSNVSVQHLSIHYDEENETFIYDRKLKEGQGDTIYGLEVCKGLGLDPSFMLLANSIRYELTDKDPNIVSTKKSKYNAKHFVDVCEICSKKASEVHHIKQQMCADEYGNIGHIHKNAKSNIMNICDDCHDMVHRGKIVVEGRVQTLEGKRLKYYYT